MQNPLPNGSLQNAIGGRPATSNLCSHIAPAANAAARVGSKSNRPIDPLELIVRLKSVTTRRKTKRNDWWRTQSLSNQSLLEFSLVSGKRTGIERISSLFDNFDSPKVQYLRNYLSGFPTILSRELLRKIRECSRLIREIWLHSTQR